MFRTLTLFLLLYATANISVINAADWGTLKGRIIYTGKVTKPEILDITRDEEVCGDLGLVDESILVNPKNQGLKNVVVWLASKSPVPVHPDFAATPKPARLDNKGCRFVPRLVRLRTNQTLLSISSDPISHNVAVYAVRNTPFSEVIPDGRALEKTFEKEEIRPIRVDCSTHAWMRAYLVITEHPYSAVTDKDGNFEIPKIPYGEWTFRFWHERPGYLEELRNDGENVKLARGRWELKINRGEINLPKLSVAKLAADE